VQRDSGDVSTVINRQTIDDTPAITRKVLELAALTPGVT